MNFWVLGVDKTKKNYSTTVKACLLQRKNYTTDLTYALHSLSYHSFTILDQWWRNNVRIQQSFLGWLLGMHQSEIHQLLSLSLVTVPEVLCESYFGPVFPSFLNWGMRNKTASASDSLFSKCRLRAIMALDLDIALYVIVIWSFPLLLIAALCHS